MRISIFGRVACAKCKATKHKIDHFINRWGVAEKVEVVFHDMETVDGLAEGAFRDVAGIPTTIVEDSDSILGRCEGDVPPSEELKLCLLGCAAN